MDIVGSLREEAKRADELEKKKHRILYIIFYTLYLIIGIIILSKISKIKNKSKFLYNYLLYNTILFIFIQTIHLFAEINRYIIFNGSISFMDEITNYLYYILYVSTILYIPAIIILFKIRKDIDDKLFTIIIIHFILQLGTIIIRNYNILKK